jgi:hypothetical protein
MKRRKANHSPLRKVFRHRSICFFTLAGAGAPTAVRADKERFGSNNFGTSSPNKGDIFFNWDTSTLFNKTL